MTEEAENTRRKILALVEALQQIPCEGTGWPKVSSKDINSLYEIFVAILELKFERDGDGDLPVQFRLVDRTKCESMHYSPVPYYHKTKTMEELLDIHRALVSNQQIASHALNTFSLLLHDRLKDLDRQVAEAKKERGKPGKP